MVFLELLEALVALLIILVFVTQIFIPLWIGGKLFPFCRKKLKRLDKEMAEAKEEIDVAQTERKVKRMKKVATILREEDSEEEGEENEEEPIPQPVVRKPRVRKPVNPRKDNTK